MQLITRFNVALLAILLAAAGFTAVVLKNSLHGQVRADMLAQARLVMDGVFAVQDYTDEEISSLLGGHPQSRSTFLPQQVPAYAARQFVEGLRNRHPDVLYREAVLDPTNPEDKASASEIEILEYFRTHTDADELVSERQSPAGQTLYLSRPIRVDDAACLGCHGSADDAPASMLQRYGRTNGFGWQLDEIIGARTVSVPMAEASTRSDQSFLLVMSLLCGALVVVVIVLNVLLHLLITRPLASLTHNTERLSRGEVDDEALAENGNKELSRLAAAVNRMHRGLRRAVKLLEDGTDLKG